MQFIPMTAKLNFQRSLLQSSVSHKTLKMSQIYTGIKNNFRDETMSSHFRRPPHVTALGGHACLNRTA